MATKSRRLPSGRIRRRVQSRAAGKVTSESFTPVDESPEKAKRAQREPTRFASLLERVGCDAATAALEPRDEVGPTVRTLEEWTMTYLDPASGRLAGVTAATRRDYRSIADRSFLQVLGPMPLDAITKQAVTKRVGCQKAQPLKHRPGQSVAVKTEKNFCALLSSTLADAVDAEVIRSNAAHKVEITRGYREGVIFLTVEEFDRLHALLPEYYRPVGSWLI